MDNDIIMQLNRAAGLAAEMDTQVQAAMTTAAALKAQAEDTSALARHLITVAGQSGLVAVIMGDVQQAGSAADTSRSHLSQAHSRIAALQGRIATAISALKNASE
jgi:hypothetical protein